MGLCVVMNRCAAVEGGAEGGEGRVKEREEVGEEIVGEEEQEVIVAGGYYSSFSDPSYYHHHYSRVFHKHGSC